MAQISRRETPPVKTRKHITPSEALDLFEAAGQATSRNAARDRCLCMVMYWHGLRCSEALALRWSNIDWTAHQLFVARLKNGIDGTHPINGMTLRALRRLYQESGGGTGNTFLFMSERGEPLSPDMVARIIARAGVLAGIPFHVKPHALRHGCGFYLSDRGTPAQVIQGYLGHREIKSTSIYVALSARAYDGLTEGTSPYKRSGMPYTPR